MTSVSVSHILIPTQPVRSGRPQWESNPGATTESQGFDNLANSVQQSSCTDSTHNQTTLKERSSQDNTTSKGQEALEGILSRKLPTCHTKN